MVVVGNVDDSKKYDYRYRCHWLVKQSNIKLNNSKLSRGKVLEEGIENNIY